MMFKWLLKLLLNSYKKSLNGDLHCAGFESDWGHLSDEDKKKVQSVQEGHPKQIQAIDTIINGVSQYKQHSRY